MITIFKNISDIPEDLEYIEVNDLFFNQNTSGKLDDKVAVIIDMIDKSKLISKFKIQSRFDNTILNTDKLSSGCKTVLNVLYYPDKVFNIKECGENALELLYSLENGKVFSDYAMIPFGMEKALICSDDGETIIDDYEMLKEWWNFEK